MTKGGCSTGRRGCRCSCTVSSRLRCVSRSVRQVTVSSRTSSPPAAKARISGLNLKSHVGVRRNLNRSSMSALFAGSGPWSESTKLRAPNLCLMFKVFASPGAGGCPPVLARLGLLCIRGHASDPLQWLIILFPKTTLVTQLFLRFPALSLQGSSYVLQLD